MNNAFTAERRKLIEVALPLEAINREATRENYIYKGNPSSLHKWWAQRPLAACRAVLFAQLVDDPSAHPERFPSRDDQAAERQRLFGLIERLVRWENAGDHDLLAEVRAEVERSLGGELPPVVDPFCGGGSIPLEAQRLGLEARASDLNPVAVLITKALIELPAQFAGRPPAHPFAIDGNLDIGDWDGAQGLAVDVRQYGAWLRDEAQRRVGQLYPPTTLCDGRRARVIAWIWARTVRCPNPACRSLMPLARSFWLSKRHGKEAWVRPVVEGKGVRFEIGRDRSGPPVLGTVNRNGATCLVCDSAVPLAHVRAEGKAGRTGMQMMAVVAEGSGERVYLPPDAEQEAAADVPRPENLPETDLPEQALGFRVQAYGMTRHVDLFTNRQLTILSTLCELVPEARERVRADAEDEEYANCVATYLAFVNDKVAEYNCSLVTWYPKEDRPKGIFARQAIPMVWDFAEVNPFCDIGGSIDASVRIVSDAIPTATTNGPKGKVAQLDASSVPQPLDVGVICTDPPYYDNVGYADLSDFFYVWLRRAIGRFYPTLFATVLTPKAEELVAEPARTAGDSASAAHRFEAGFSRTFVYLASKMHPQVPMTLFYAFKQAEGSDGAGQVSTGWETMLEALLGADLAVTATWPIRSERGGRMRDVGSNALASSIVLACRPRADDVGITDRRGFLASLSTALPRAVRDLQEGNIAPVDLAQAAIGPGMAVFSQFAKVIEPDGSPMRVRTALGLINQALDEVLAEQEGEFDSDTRWAVAWYEQQGFQPGRFGDAETLSKAKVTSVAHLAEVGIVHASAGLVRLLGREERGAHRDRPPHPSVWTLTQRLVRALEAEGEEAAAQILAGAGPMAGAARDLAYRLFVAAERRGRASDALAFNSLVSVWPELTRLAVARDAATAVQESLL